MSINILSLNATIYNKLNEELDLSSRQISLITTMLSDSSLTSDQKKDLEEIRLKLIENQTTDRVVFLQKTHSLINEYIRIINIPLYSSEDNQHILQKKQTIVNEFLDIIYQLKKTKGWLDLEIPNTVPLIKQTTYCCSCHNNNSDMFEMDEYNNKICMYCANQDVCLETGITYKDYGRVNVMNRFIYNRVIHFNDCIKQYQGKQNCKIPEEIFENLEKKFLSHRLLVITDNKNIQRPDPVRYSAITRDHIIMFLKDLKYTKQYENTNLIFYMLTNKRVDDITYLEDSLIDDFKKLIRLYDEECNKEKTERKNFLNSSYLLFQLLRRHGHQCKIENFSILKTIDRKIFHDNICKKLFSHLRWKFTDIF
jgi:hypothetical protein